MVAAARSSATSAPVGRRELSAEARDRLRALQARDLDVRAHESAHVAAAGALAGGTSYDYVLGPDGRLYAVAGEVSIRLQRGDTPEETMRIARQVRAAALAPADPSSQDQSVASAAAALEAAAQRERASLRRAEEEEKRANGGAAPPMLPVASLLEAERMAMYGSIGHSHFESSCGFCSAAALRYR